jgi:cytochrome c oxidase subunit I
MAKSKQSPEIHLPPPSYWPILVALGMILIAIGVILSLIVTAIGIVVLLASIVGWTQENRVIATHEEGRHE